MSGPHREQFIKAMYKEIKTLENLKTWNVIQKSDVPTDQKVIPSTWAFKIKRYPDERLRKFKARFCVRGDRQEEVVDYFESYAPVVSWATVRMLMRIAIKEGWKSRQVDFQNAFAQAPIREEVYINMPPMFGESSKNTLMKLNKSLYGLVQAPLTWYDRLKKELERLGFEPSERDPCLFYRKDMIALVYVDDVVFFGKDIEKMDEVIQKCQDDGYPLTKEDDLFHFLGIDVKQDPETKKVTLTQLVLIENVLTYVGMSDCNTKAVPAQKMPLGTNANGESFDEEWD